MIELCRTEGQKLLFEGRYDRVVPAALESLKFSIEVYGLSSIELVPSYLILGEASIGQYNEVILRAKFSRVFFKEFWEQEKGKCYRRMYFERGSTSEYKIVTGYQTFARELCVANRESSYLRCLMNTMFRQKFNFFLSF